MATKKMMMQDTKKTNKKKKVSKKMTAKKKAKNRVEKRVAKKKKVAKGLPTNFFGFDMEIRTSLLYSLSLNCIPCAKCKTHYTCCAVVFAPLPLYRARPCKLFVMQD